MWRRRSKNSGTGCQMTCSLCAQKGWEEAQRNPAVPIRDWTIQSAFKKGHGKTKSAGGEAPASGRHHYVAANSGFLAAGPTCSAKIMNINETWCKLLMQFSVSTEPVMEGKAPLEHAKHELAFRASPGGPAVQDPNSRNVVLMSDLWFIRFCDQPALLKWNSCKLQFDAQEEDKEVQQEGTCSLILLLLQWRLMISANKSLNKCQRDICILIGQLKLSRICQQA